MNLRKLLLAEIRQGNYAHAGEVEAIELAINHLKKGKNQTVLDVGCGLGGTADYFQKNGFGKIIGIDIDDTVISDAKKLYPNINFYLCDAIHVNQLFKNIKFNIIYSFNAFFCFKDKDRILRSFYEIAENGAELLLFDYSCNGAFLQDSPFLDKTQKSTAAANFDPIDLTMIEENLKNSHWQLKEIVNLDDQFKKWYREVITKMEVKKEFLVLKFGIVTFDDIYQGFVRLLVLLENNLVGGSIIYANREK